MNYKKEEKMIREHKYTKNNLLGFKSYFTLGIELNNIKNDFNKTMSTVVDQIVSK